MLAGICTVSLSRFQCMPFLLMLASSAALAQTPASAGAGTARLDPSLAADVVELDNPAFPPEPARALPPRGTSVAELLPVPASGPLREAAAALELGQPATALGLLAGVPDTPAVLFLRTLAGLRQAPTPRLARTMEGLAQQFPALADRCAVHAAAADEEFGELAIARRLFSSVSSGSRVYAEARFGLARVLRRLGELQAATEALAPLAATPPPPSGRDIGAEALLLRAELARTRRDSEAERTELLELWTHHPKSPLALESERRLGGRIPLVAKVVRAEVLVDMQRSRDALRLLEAFRLSPPDALGCRAELVRGRALRKERRHAEVERVLAPVIARCTEPDLRVRALYVLGASQAVVRPEAGVVTYEALAREFPDHPYADDALYLAAELLAASGDVAGALDRLEAVAARYPHGDFAGEALFKTFWLHHRLDDDLTGLVSLARVEEQFAGAEDTYDVERARYWRARVLDAHGEPATARALWEALGREHPATYYGLLARTRIAERDPAGAVELARSATPTTAADFPAVVDAGSLTTDRHYQAGSQLLSLGFGEAASEELLAVRRSEQPRDAVRVLVQALTRTGDLRAAQAVARTDLRWALTGQLTPALRDVWEAAYPKAYRELVERFCKLPRVDPDLLQALMREESALDPRALSWAGALGLTQLMLPTAQAVARELRLGKPSPEGLFDPGLNIQLGAAYLGRLLARFGGNAVYALASYNAGASTVEHWRSSRSGLELDAFVEEIPLSETRGYVKRVLRSYNAYRLLGGRPLVTAEVEMSPGEAAEARAAPAPSR
jgi:soluble lytic murein transglycosylase